MMEGSLSFPRKSDMKPLGESRSQAVRRFFALEHTLQSKDQFKELKSVLDEYFEMGHAEPVPYSDLNKPPEEVQCFLTYPDTMVQFTY